MSSHWTYRSGISKSRNARKQETKRHKCSKQAEPYRDGLGPRLGSGRDVPALKLFLMKDVFGACTFSWTTPSNAVFKRRFLIETASMHG